MKRNNYPSKVLDILKDFINNNKIFLIYVVISVLIGFLLRVNTVGFPLTFKASLSDLIVVLIVGSFSYLFKKNYRYVYFLIMIILSSLLSIGNTIYYDFYQSFISINLLGTAAMVSQVNDALWAKLMV